ncbi:hypothetical protein [Psychrobacillus sp. FSL K6-1267]|uniref:hypothetical protein n=1 Tax=Psychrobacillus sp. FSL K6-1267 TaxID=2921543 RepID=UPI0030FA5A29
MIITLSTPKKLGEKIVKKIDLKLEDLTGKEILKIDSELRMEGHSQGLRDVFDQNVLLKIASKSSGILTDDLEKLAAPDFLEVTFSVRNFLLGWSASTEEQKNSEES